MSEEDREDTRQSRAGVSVVGTRLGKSASYNAPGRQRRRPNRPSTEEAVALDEVVLSPQEAPDEVAAEDHGFEAGGGPRTRRVASGHAPRALSAGVSRRVALLLGSLAVVGAVSGIGFGLAWANLNSQNQTRQAVKNAATTFLLDLTNFKPKTVDTDFAALQNWASSGSQFAKQAAQTFNSGIRQDLIQAQATSQGEIRDIYVENLSGSGAEVYGVVDQSYQNAKMTSPDTDTLRVDVELSDSSNGWRVNTVTVENPSGIDSSPTP